MYYRRLSRKPTEMHILHRSLITITVKWKGKKGRRMSEDHDNRDDQNDNIDILIIYAK